jgi:hypothetical protein
MRKQLIRSSQTLLTVAATVILASCAAPADPSHMVPTNAAVRRSHRSTVDLEVGGGRDTNPLSTSQVENEGFRKALQDSLLRYGVFSRVVQNESATYRLDVALVDLRQPAFGFNVTVVAKIQWALMDEKTSRIVWRETFETPYTATVGQAVYGVHRLELANEGAIRASIKRGIEALGRLDYP